MAKEIPSRRLKVLYHFYSRSEHWANALWLRVRPAGIACSLVIIISSAMSIGQPKDSLLYLFCFSTVLMVCALVGFIIRRANLSCTTEIPTVAEEGEIVNYHVTVKNHNNRHLRSVGIIPAQNNLTISFEKFANTPEPGETQRNLFDRKMVFFRWKWLNEKNTQNVIYNLGKFSDFAAKEEKTFTFKFLNTRRGEYSCSKNHVLLPEPIGLFQRCKTLNSDRGKIWILPRRFPVTFPNFVNPGGTQQTVINTHSRVGDNGDFFSLRDYRSGDSRRQIDWKSWAKTGKPVIKEVEQLSQIRYRLVVDLENLTQVSDEAFEDLLRIVASIAMPIDPHTQAPTEIWMGRKIFKKPDAKAFDINRDFLHHLASITKETIVHQQSMECFIDELKSTNEPLLYVSFDNHQRLYKKLVNTGISVTVLPLDRLKIDHPLTVT